MSLNTVIQQKQGVLKLQEINLLYEKNETKKNINYNF